MKFFSFIAVFSSMFFFSLFSFSQSFEGEIGFTKKTLNETYNYRYYVKNENVRIEEFDDEKKLIGIVLVNINSYDAILINIDRKLFVDLEKNNVKLTKIQGMDIKNSSSMKKIAGYDCKEVVVKNKKENNEVVYYNHKANYSFFKGLLITLNRKDLASLYFQQIPDINDVFPFMAIEKDASGKVLTTFEVTDVVSKKVDDKLFEIPKGYSKL